MPALLSINYARWSITCQISGLGRTVCLANLVQSESSQHDDRTSIVAERNA